MSAVKEVFSILAARAEEAIPVHNCDYTDEATGLLICGKCRSPKQCRPFPDSDFAVYCLCDCMKADDDAMHERLRQNQIEQRRMICFGSSDLIRATFADDDCKDPRLTETCKAFSERVTGDSSRDWLLLWGDCGTGKSFMAACIANAAIDTGMTARFITVSEIEQHLWNSPDKAAVYDEMNHTGLLVIDDFGCERRTEYMDEIKFNLIDGRLRSGKPCVITTNLMLNDFAAPADLTQKRIVSRMFERAATFHVQGEDRRFTALKERAARSSSSSNKTTEEE